MDINRLSLYLSGRLPPYYRAEYDRLKLIEKTRWFSSKAYSEDFLKLIDSDRFYSLILNKLKDSDYDALDRLVDNLIKEENIPDDVVLLYTENNKGNRWEIKSTEDENRELKEKIKELTKPVLITEGKTDVKILETAWSKLYPDKEIPFDIIENWRIKEDWNISWWGADGLKNQLEFCYWISKNKTVIWLFDNDKEWNEQFKWLNKNIFETYDISKDIRKHKLWNIYWLLIPVPAFRTEYFNENDIKKRCFVIEHYFENDILRQNKMIKESNNINWNEIIAIWNSKDAFANSIKNLDSSAFENFRILFNRINLYI